MFPPSFKGTVTMRIDLIQNKPEEEIYEMRIIDTCTQEVEEEIEVPVGDEGEVENQTRTFIKQLGQQVTRFKTITYTELDALSSILNVDMSDKTKIRENINELFRLGLLIITRKECSEGEGMYFSDSEDWEIVRG